MRILQMLILAAGSLFAAINHNPDPLGPPWLADGYTEPLIRPALSMADVYAHRSGLAKTAAVLPARIDHSHEVWTHPVFNQDGGSCGSASRITYMFGYERNCYKNLDGSDSLNMFPSHFTWMLTSQGSSKEEMAIANGIPDAVAYGGGTYSRTFGRADDDGFSTTDYGWMQGFERWRGAMDNRIVKNSFLDLNTPENLIILKQWMVDHWGDNGFAGGGIAGAGVASSGWSDQVIPAGQFGAGSHVITAFGPQVDHGVTWAGYDDSIGWDYNGNGIIDENTGDMETWEKGALILLNSWGESWDNEGCVYVPYRLLKTTGRAAEFYFYRKDYTPGRVMKISMNYSKRVQIKLSVGIAADTNATVPERVIDCDHFKFGGRGDVPMLGTWADGTVHTESMEFGYDLTDLAFGFDTQKPLKYFLQITSDAAANGSGVVDSIAVLDYLGSDIQTSTASVQTGVAIGGGGAITRVSVVTGASTGNPPEHILIPQSNMRVIAWDSENSDGRALNIIDGSTATIWHSRWSPVTDALPHWVIVDLGSSYAVSAFSYNARTEGENGMVKNFEFFVSNDTANWGDVAVGGNLEATSAEQRIMLPTAVTGRYVKFLALSSTNGLAFTSMAEFNVFKSPDDITPIVFSAKPDRASGFRCVNVSGGRVRFSSPAQHKGEFCVYSAAGRLISRQSFAAGAEGVELGRVGAGCYVVRMGGENGTGSGRLLIP